MTDLKASIPEGDSKAADQLRGLLEGLFAIGLLVGRAMIAIQHAIAAGADEIERRHHRAELLAAYRRRPAWKTSDIPHLKSLGVSDVALRRMATIEGKKGRPVVKPHQPAAQALMSKVLPLWTVVDPKGTPEGRRRALKNTPWFNHHVEALYRGERDLARANRTPGPADHAERTVGRALGILASTVHRICGEINRKRKEWDGAADFPPMTLVEFNAWMETGERKWSEAD